MIWMEDVCPTRTTDLWLSMLELIKIVNTAEGGIGIEGEQVLGVRVEVQLQMISATIVIKRATGQQIAERIQYPWHVKFAKVDASTAERKAINVMSVELKKSVDPIEIIVVKDLTHADILHLEVAPCPLYLVHRSINLIDETRHQDLLLDPKNLAPLMWRSKSAILSKKRRPSKAASAIRVTNRIALTNAVTKDQSLPTEKTPRAQLLRTRLSLHHQFRKKSGAPSPLQALGITFVKMIPATRLSEYELLFNK